MTKLIDFNWLKNYVFEKILLVDKKLLQMLVIFLQT